LAKDNMRRTQAQALPKDGKELSATKLYNSTITSSEAASD